MTKERRNLSLDKVTLDQVRTILQDPVRGRTRHGSLSALVNSLLLAFVASEIAERQKAEKVKEVAHD